mgnify:CR=1 FL=1
MATKPSTVTEEFLVKAMVSTPAAVTISEAADVDITQVPSLNGTMLIFNETTQKWTAAKKVDGGRY